MFFYKLKEILFIIYDWLPKSVREFISPLVEPIFFFIKRVFLVASQIQLSVYLLRGKEKCSGNGLSTLFFGGERVLPYFSELLYSEEPIKENLGKIFIWNIKSKLNSKFPGADIIFIGVDGFFSQFLSRKGFTIIPEWVLFILNLSKPLSKTWKLSKNKSLREDLRKVKKNKYSYEMTHHVTEFEYFYHHMYLPYVPKRFGRLTIPTSFRHMKLIFEKGQLLLVKQGNESISGNIIRTYNKSAFNAYLGIREGKIKYLKQGAIAASYYFTILWAKERGYKWLDFGHCRPFFNDGLFYYKKKWGTEIKKSKRLQNILGMKIINYHQGVLNFLEKNPFIFIDHNKLKGLIFIDQEKPLTLKEVKSLFNKYYISGINNVIVISPQRFTEKVKKFANSMSTQKLNLIRIDPDLFFKKFPHIMKLENYYDSLN